MDPEVKPNTAGGPRTSTMQINPVHPDSEQKAAQKFDPGTIRLLSNTTKETGWVTRCRIRLSPRGADTSGRHRSEIRPR